MVGSVLTGERRATYRRHLFACEDQIIEKRDHLVNIYVIFRRDERVFHADAAFLGCSILELEVSVELPLNLTYIQCLKPLNKIPKGGTIQVCFICRFDMSSPGSQTFINIRRPGAASTESAIAAIASTTQFR